MLELFSFWGVYFISIYFALSSAIAVSYMHVYRILVVSIFSKNSIVVGVRFLDFFFI